MAKLRPTKALARIADIIETAEQWCLAADGPVIPTSEAISEEDLKKIYGLAKMMDEKWRPNAPYSQ